MRFHILSVRTFFNDTPIRAIHSHFFHGKAKRGGAFPSSTDYRLSHPLDLPLRLHKNVYKLPQLFAPGLQLVVSEQLARELEAVCQVKSAECIFELLYQYPFEPGNLGCGFDRYDRQMEFIDNQSDDASLHDRVPRYFHLQMPIIREVRNAYPGQQVVTVQHKSELIDLPMSEQLLSEVPLYSFGGTKIIRDDVFDILEPFVDRLYFTHVSEECPNS